MDNFIDKKALAINLLVASADEGYSKILSATTRTSKTVQDISEETGIPIASCYRKINQLMDGGLLGKGGKIFRPKGKRRCNSYRSRVVYANISVNNGVRVVDARIDWIDLQEKLSLDDLYNTPYIKGS